MNASLPGASSSLRFMAHRIFVGIDGIRAGWAVLAFLCLLTLFGYATLLALPSLRYTPSEVPPGFAILREGILLLVIWAATAVMARMEARSVWSYGLQGSSGHFLFGCVWGFLLLSLLIGLMAATHHFAFDGRLLHDGQILGYGSAWAACFLVVAISEETLFRGYLLATLSRGIGFWPAALLLSGTFGAAHLRNHGEDLSGAAVAALGGIVFSLCLRLSGSLWWGIGFHFTWDWAQSFFYGTRDSGYLVRGHLFGSHPIGDVRMSGGSVGPEGSVFVLPVLCIALVVISVTLRRHTLSDSPKLTTPMR